MKKISILYGIYIALFILAVFMGNALATYQIPYIEKIWHIPANSVLTYYNQNIASENSKKNFTKNSLKTAKADLLRGPITREEAKKLLGGPATEIPEPLSQKMRLMGETLYFPNLDSHPRQVMQLWYQNKDPLKHIIVEQRRITPGELPLEYPWTAKLNNGLLANIWAHTRIEESEHQVQELLKDNIFVMAKHNPVFQQEPAEVHTLWHAQWIKDEIVYSLTATNINRDNFLDVINLI